MFEHITRSINNYATLSEQEVELFLSYLRVREIPRGKKLLNKGEVCQEVSFINHGSFVQSYADEELNQNVINLFVTHDWVLNHTSFTSQKPSMHTIEAFEDSEILTINIHQVHELIGKHPAFFALGKILEVVAPYSDMKKSPDVRYQMLLKEKPMILKTFPLKYIASYLGITPETLSRVRNRLP